MVGSQGFVFPLHFYYFQLRMNVSATISMRTFATHKLCYGNAMGFLVTPLTPLPGSIMLYARPVWLTVFLMFTFSMNI